MENTIKEQIELATKEILLLKLKIKSLNTSQTEVMEVLAEGTPEEKALFYWTQAKKTVKDKRGRKVLRGGWKVINKTKVNKSWTKEGIVKEKEFEAVDVERDGVTQQLVYAGGIFRAW